MVLHVLKKIKVITEKAEIEQNFYIFFVFALKPGSTYNYQSFKVVTKLDALFAYVLLGRQSVA